MYSYADQNLILKCRDSQDFRKIVAEAQKHGITKLVLSPMHFYEIGTVREELFEATIAFVEAIQPAWTMSRADLLLREFAAEWNRHWRLEPYKFEAVGDLANAASAMHRRPAELFANFTARDFIAPFRQEQRAAETDDQFEELRSVFDSNKSASFENRSRFKDGQLTPAVLREVERRYVATQLARLREEAPSIPELHQRADRILANPYYFQRLSIFVENGATQRLKAHVVENLMTLDNWKGEATLKENRQVDQEHAIIALAYCSVFVTSDEGLGKKCERIRSVCSFKLADVLSVNDWIAKLKKALR